jgi:hypothetical protein
MQIKFLLLSALVSLNAYAAGETFEIGGTSFKDCKLGNNVAVDLSKETFAAALKEAQVEPADAEGLRQLVIDMTDEQLAPSKVLIHSVPGCSTEAATQICSYEINCMTYIDDIGATFPTRLSLVCKKTSPASSKVCPAMKDCANSIDAMALESGTVAESVSVVQPVAPGSSEESSAAPAAIPANL